MPRRRSSPPSGSMPAPARGRFPLVDPERSALMRRIRSSGTTPELIVRRALHALGLRFRLHRDDLPGRPDIVLAKHRLVVFVHGCFWHQHTGCRLASRPKSRTEYWTPKLAANVARDQRHTLELNALGWRVETVWECDTRDSKRLSESLDAIRLALL